MDQAAQSLQPGNLQAGKLTAENAVPLRSYATSVDVPVGQAEWGDKVMGKLSFLTARNMKEAEIHLTPPDMGPMEVKVRMHNEQAHVTVHAANPVVREQLELNSHRLRDMLGEQGVELGQFDVSSQSEQQTSEQGDEAGTGGSGQGGGALAQGESEMDDVQASHLDLSWKGEVDLFA
jgi:flagellar hook-length control protein FliK